MIARQIERPWAAQGKGGKRRGDGGRFDEAQLRRKR